MLRTERAALLTSAAAAALIGAVALVAAGLSHSQAILLDGLFNVAYFAAALLTLRVAALARRPDDERFPFGYVYFEPLINAAKGLLILGVSVFALVEAVIALLSGGRAMQTGPAIAYGVFATVVCVGVWLSLRRAPCRGGSPLVRADADNWMLNALISGGVLGGFAGAWALQNAGMAAAAAHVDPALVAAIVLLSIGVPVRMAWQGVTALLNRAPPPSVTQAIRAAAQGALSPLPVRALFVRAVRPGRTTCVMVHALLDRSQSDLRLADADAIRARIVQALAADHAPVVVDVVFTAVPEYAQPGLPFAAGS
ncbi:MAG: cation diffusion facilitator family transporter [Rubrimonas sp.]